MRWAGAWVIAQDVLPGFSHSLKFSHLVRRIDIWRGAGPRTHFCNRFISLHLCSRNHGSIPGPGAHGSDGYRVLARPADAGQPGVSYGEPTTGTPPARVGPRRGASRKPRPLICPPKGGYPRQPSRRQRAVVDGREWADPDGHRQPKLSPPAFSQPGSATQAGHPTSVPPHRAWLLRPSVRRRPW